MDASAGISGISLELVDRRPNGPDRRLERDDRRRGNADLRPLGQSRNGFVLERAKSEKTIPTGTLRNVSFANIVATRAGKTGCSIVGLPGHPVENVSLSNVTIRSEAAEKASGRWPRSRKTPRAIPRRPCSENCRRMGCIAATCAD